MSLSALSSPFDQYQLTSNAKWKHDRHLLHWIAQIMPDVNTECVRESLNSLLWNKVHQVVRWTFVGGVKTILKDLGFAFCCCLPLLSYEVTLDNSARIRDYSFLPASSPCFDPFPLFRHQAPSLRPAVPHLWINWAQWMDRFYLHQAGYTPKEHFPCLLFPALGSSSAWPLECYLLRPLCSWCFLPSEE